MTRDGPGAAGGPAGRPLALRRSARSRLSPSPPGFSRQTAPAQRRSSEHQRKAVQLLDLFRLLGPVSASSSRWSMRSEKRTHRPRSVATEIPRRWVVFAIRQQALLVDVARRARYSSRISPGEMILTFRGSAPARRLQRRIGLRYLDAFSAPPVARRPADSIEPALFTPVGDQNDDTGARSSTCASD